MRSALVGTILCGIFLFLVMGGFNALNGIKPCPTPVSSTVVAVPEPGANIARRLNRSNQEIACMNPGVIVNALTPVPSGYYLRLPAPAAKGTPPPGPNAANYAAAVMIILAGGFGMWLFIFRLNGFGKIGSVIFKVTEWSKDAKKE